MEDEEAVMDLEPECTSLIDLLLRDQFTSSKPTGSLKVERVLGKSAATRVYARYPFQFMVPKKAIPSGVDAVLVYALTFGGGIVSGDSTSCELDVGADSTMTLTTQGCTNVYKAVEGQTSHQTLKCAVGSGALLAILPDSVVCFATARYCQVQAFDLAPDASLVLVDWLTGGRIARGEIWDFDSFRSTNHIYIQGNTPLVLDSVCLEKDFGPPIGERMGDFHVIGMMVIYGPRLAELRKRVQLSVDNIASKALNCNRLSGLGGAEKHAKCPGQTLPTPALFASCSIVGLSGEGLVVRVAATTTALVYSFLRQQLAPLQPMIGLLPYSS